MIEAEIGRFRGSFSPGQLESACPGVSREMISYTSEPRWQFVAAQLKQATDRR